MNAVNAEVPDLRCLGCGYDLAGSEVHGLCPECGVTARITLDPPVRDRYVGMTRLRTGLRRLGSGLAIYALGVPVFALLLFVSPPSRFGGILTLAQFVAAFAGLVAVAGGAWWLVAVCQLARRSTTRPWPTLATSGRRTLLAAATAVMTSFAATILGYQNGATSLIATLTRDAVTLGLDLLLLRLLVVAGAALFRSATLTGAIRAFAILGFVCTAVMAVARFYGTPLDFREPAAVGVETPADRFAVSMGFGALVFQTLTGLSLAISALRLARDVEPVSLSQWAPDRSA